MYFAVTEVQPLENYLLSLKFKNGESKLFDMKPYLETGVFKELKNESVFKNVKVSFDTIEWTNEIDIDPETLYHESIPIK
jgi:hypothetical protein